MLNMDLIKSYDWVNWVFLRLILLYIGMELSLVNWIMVCVTSEFFPVLINGSPTGFFNASRGLRHGCSLSPLLFLLVIEGLSLLIGKAKTQGDLHGIKYNSSLAITHLLFVDDVVLFSVGTMMTC